MPFPGPGKPRVHLPGLHSLPSAQHTCSQDLESLQASLDTPQGTYHLPGNTGAFFH